MTTITHEDDEDDEDVMQCGIFGHEPGDAPWRCGACGARIAHTVAPIGGGDWCACGLLADDGIHIREDNR